ncbi:hypothetical protein STEG23_017075, partial [Scotinomys teguina]
MRPDRTTNTGNGTMVVAAAPRCQMLLIELMAAMLLPGMKGSPLLVRRKIARTIKLQGSIGKDLIMWSRQTREWDLSAPANNRPVLQLKSSSAQVLVVEPYICFHQLLDVGSRMTI